MAGQLVAIQAFDSNGVPVAGAKFKTEAAGTTTPKAAYADEAGTVALSNPVTTNAAGIAACWLKSGIGDYKISLTDPTGSVFLFRTIDNYTPATDSILYIIGSDIETARTEALDAATAAELAQSLAETAQANAETAEQNAENAQTGAQSAQAAAAASAATATTQAGIATTQAGIATTQAGLAATARTGAETAETNAETAQAAAEAAQAFTQAYADADIDEPVEGQGIVTFNPATAINLATNVITIAGNTLLQDEPVTYRNGGGTAPPGLTHDAQYWVVNKSGNDFALSATRGGAPVDITGAGAGTTHQLLPVRSAKDRAHYARQSELAARADAVDAAATLAAIEEIHLGSFANAAAAWAATGAATGALYFDTTIGALYVLGAAAPAAERFAPPLASQAQAEAGTENSAYMSALRTAQAIAALSPSPTTASQAEAEAGTDNTKFITPLRMGQGAPVVMFGTKERTSKYFGIKSDGSADDTTAWGDAITEINAGNVTSFRVGAGRSIITSNLAAITADDIAIRGVGPASAIVMSAAGASGQVLLFGVNPSNSMNRVIVEDLRLEAVGNPAANQFLIKCARANSLTIRNIIARGHSALFHAEICGNVLIDNINAIANASQDYSSNIGGSDAIIKLEDCAGMWLTNIVHSSALHVGNTDANGKMIYIVPPTGGSIDTIFINKCRLQMYTDDTLPGVDGRPYIVYVEKQAGLSGSITNLWICDNAFDHSSLIALLLEVNATNSGNSRPWWISQNRMVTDSGRGAYINHAGTGTQTGLKIIANDVVIKDNSVGIELKGDNLHDWDLALNTVKDRNNATAKDYAYVINAGNGSIEGNRVENDDDAHTATGFVTAFRLVGSTRENIYFGPNNFAPTCANLLSEPGYTTQMRERVIIKPLDLQRVRPDHRLYFHDDFLQAGSTAFGAFWKVAQGSSASAPTVAETSGGSAALITPASGSTMATSGVQISGPLTSFGSFDIAMEGRWLVNNTTNVRVFMGFTDQNAALEMPFTLSGTALTSNASDAVGILYDADATAGNYHCVGVDSDVDATRIDSGVAISTAYTTFRVELYNTGVAKFYINGALVGTMSAACSNNVILCPYFGGFSSSAARTIRMDYAMIEASRV